MEVWLVICGVGAAASAACFVLALAAAIHAVPADELPTSTAPPRVLRLVWPAVRIAAHHLGPRLGPSQRAAIAVRLRRAEFEACVRPEHWVAGGLVYGVLAAAVFALVGSACGVPVPTAIVTGALAGVLLPQLLMRDAIARRELRIQRELPTYLDVITLAVESGCSLVAAVGVAIDKAGDGPLRRALQRFLAELRAGRSRADALRSLDAWVGMPAVTALVGALLQAERTGARLGDVLRAQSAQRTNERFARAEKLAMQAPVKMLGPLILCIFPCTFLILGFPIGMKLAEGF